MNNMTYEEKYDAVQAFCDKYESLIDKAPEGSDLWAFKGLDDTMMDIEAVLCDDSEMLLPSNVDGLNRAKAQIINAMLHIAERWSEVNTAEWVDKEVRGTMAPVCSRCGADSIYPTKYCGNCGICMMNGY